VNGRRSRTLLGWALPAVVVLVLAGGIGAGLGIRELGARAGGDDPGVTAPQTVSPGGSLPGPSTVELSQDAAAHPEASRIQDLLQRHFNAINNRDYAAWTSTVVARRSAEMAEPQWQRDYASSRDGGILVNRIEPSRDGAVVLLAFTSTQEPAFAPANLPDSRCTRWWVSYRVVSERGQPRIDAGIKHTALNADCTDEL